MKHHLNFSRNNPNYSFKHSFGLIFKKIETVLFSFLCVIFLVVSKLDSNFSKRLSFKFVSISMPVVKTVSFPFNSTINLLINFRELLEAKKENEILKEDLTELRKFYIESLNIYQENKELRNILNFIRTKSSNFKMARITGRSHQLFNQKLFIDSGKKQGIEENNIVTGKRGVVGRITEVEDSKSRLILLTDAISRIPIITSKSRVRGIAAGNNSDLIEILFLPKTHNIKPGELVFTSGDGDTLPPGLLIGVVRKVSENGTFLTMAEDINNTEVVTIIGY